MFGTSDGDLALFSVFARVMITRGRRLLEWSCGRGYKRDTSFNTLTLI
jgi:hypothetical protein